VVPGLTGFDEAAAVVKLRTRFDERIVQLRALVAAGQDPHLPRAARNTLDSVAGWLISARRTARAR
jgi:hypothetical protein